MDSFSNEDIDLFINSYYKHISDNQVLNENIPIWVEYLKTKKPKDHFGFSFLQI